MFFENTTRNLHQKTSNNYTKETFDGIPDILIHNAKILSKKACDATLGKLNKSFVAFSNNILTLFIRTLKIPVQCLRHIINTHPER